MIFKTFDSKIDKWTSKIGIFGKSFNELGTAVNEAFKSAIDNLDNFDENVGFWESLKNNLFSKKADKDWIKNSLGDIISKENINSYIAELDLDSAKDKLENMFDWDNKIKNNKATWQDYFDTLDDGESYIVDLIKNTDDLSKLTGEDLVKANQQARASALAHNEAIKAQTFSAKAGKVALQALATAGNMIAMWAITKGIELAVKGIDELAHGAENAIEKVETSIDAYKTATSELESGEESLSEIKNRIKEIESLGTPSLSDESELERLQNESAELERQIALLKQRQLISARELMKDATDSFNKKQVYGQHGYQSNQEAFDNAMSEYEKYQRYILQKKEELDVFIQKNNMSDVSDVKELNDIQKHEYDALQEQITYAEKAFDEQKDIIEQSYEGSAKLIESYDLVIENGGELSNSEKELYNQAKENQQAYLAYSYAIYNNAEAYKSLDIETKKLVASQKLLQQGLSQEQANSVISNFTEDDLNSFYAVKFDFVAPNPDDYDSVSEYGKAYADALLYSIKDTIESNKDVENSLFESFSDTDLGTRLQHITDLFNEGSISHKEYFDALQSEINNFDASNFTDSIEDMDKASAQFFVDSMQQTANGLSSLINSFDNGEMSISEYLEGYLAIGNTLNTLTDNLQENSAAWSEHGEAISDVGNTALDDTQNKLNSAMSVIESYQDSIYSLEQIMNDAVTVGSDEFTAHANVIAEDLYRIVQNGGEMADAIASTLGTTTSEIAKSLTENVSNQELACQAIAANTNTAIGDMATSIGELFDTLGNAISNFKVDLAFGVSDFSLKKVVLGLLGVQELPEIKFSLSASGESLDKIGSAISSFGKTVASNYKPQTIDLDDFHFGSTDKGKERKYSPSSGVTKNYENALDKIKDSAKGAKSAGESVKSEYEELFNFFEQRIKVLDDALSLLKSNLDNVAGSYAKNNIIDAELGITEEKFKNYSDALSMYTEKANEALSKLPSDIAIKIKDGAVDLTTFIGDVNKEVVEAIKDYEQWADKVSDCKQELAELKSTIRELELEKFNNIVDDFTNQFNIHEDGKDLISKQIDLLKEAGELIGESFFTAQIEQSKKQLTLLEEEKVQLVGQMNSAISSGKVQEGTDEWLEMANSLSDVEGNILDCKKAIEGFDNELLQLHWDVFDRIQGQFKDLDSELSNLRGLFEDSKVTDENFNWTKESLAQLGLLTQQYELAQYQVQQYNDELNQLNSDYLAGKYSATEYADKLSELSSAQWDAVNASESIKDSIIDLNETRVNEEINAIEKEIDAYRELIDSQIEALKSAKDLHDYQESIAEKTKSVNDLERKIAAMANDDSAASVAKRKQLEEQLIEARKELENEQYNHSIEEQENALNKQFESYEEERNKEIDVLRESLEDHEALISASFETVKNNSAIIGQEIAAIATEHGITISNAIISSWQNGENAIASYGSILSEQSSAFIGNIMGVENEVYSLQYKANETANSLSWMFGTRADTLISELTASYYSEQNLNYMTQALRDSLVNTLEGGYNISGISNALSGIANGLDGVASAAQRAANAISSVGAGQTTNYNPSNSGASSSGLLQAIKDTNSVVQPIISNIPKKKPSGGGSGGGKQMTMMAYAKGGIIKKDAGNPLNRIAESVGEDTIIAAKEGESILTERQTAAYQKLAQLFGADENGKIEIPDDFNVVSLSDLSNVKLDASLFDSGISRISNRSEIISSSSKDSHINVNYGSLITVNGDVNDTKHFLNDMQNVAQNAIKKSWHDFEMTRKYGMY